MQNLGIQSEREFRDSFLTAVPSAVNPVRISGAVDFAMEKSRLFSVTDILDAKIPPSDIYNNTGVHFAHEINARPILLTDVKKMLLISKPETINISALQPVLSPREELAAEILDARKSILTMAMVDKEFANSTGFGYFGIPTELVRINIAPYIVQTEPK